MTTRMGSLLLMAAVCWAGASQDLQADAVPPEAVPKEWIDPATGHRVVRLSELPGSVSFYFHQNAYTPEGDKLLISTPRGLETVDLATRELNVVVPRESLRLGGSSGLEMGRKTRQVYYTVRGDEGLVLRATNVDTRETRDLVRLPFGASFNSINADETLAFGSMRDFVPGQPRRSRSGPRQMRLFTANLATGEITTLSRVDRLAQSPAVFTDGSDVWALLP